MKVMVDRNQLHRALTDSLRMLPRHRGFALPIMNNVLIEAVVGHGLVITSGNLDHGQRTAVSCDPELTAAGICNSLTLKEILASTDPGEVELDLEEDQVFLRRESFEYQMKPGDKASEYPAWRFPGSDAISFNLDARELKLMLNRAVFCVAQSDESRTVLTCVNFSVTKNVLTLIATDGRRLSVQTLEGVEVVDDFSYNVPGVFLKILAPLLGRTGGPVRVSFEPATAHFTVGNVSLFCRLVEGTSIDYKRVIPKEKAILSRAEMGKESLSYALRRLMAVACQRDRIGGVEFEFARNCSSVTLTSETDADLFREIGSELVFLGEKYEGDSKTLAFNGFYLLDFLKQVDSDIVHWDIQCESKSVVLRPEKEDSGKATFSYILMPCRPRKRAESIEGGQAE